jgi:hypothetical protein
MDVIILDDMAHAACLVGCMGPYMIFVWLAEWNGMSWYMHHVWLGVQSIQEIFVCTIYLHSFLLQEFGKYMNATIYNKQLKLCKSSSFSYILY